MARRPTQLKKLETYNDIVNAEYNLYDKEYEKTINLKGIKDDKLFNIVQKHIEERHNMRDHLLTKNVTKLKYAYTFDKKNVITVCFRLAERGLSTVYAMLYSRWDNKINEPIHYAVAYGAALESRDGEYRSPVIQWKHYEVISQIYKKGLDVAETYIVDRLDQGLFNYEVMYHFPPNFSHKDEFREYVERQRIEIGFHTLCWIRDFGRISRGQEENHMNDIYKALIHRETIKKEATIVFKDDTR